MRIIVVGTGGVGGYFGAKLARAGESVTFIARGEHLRTIQKNGLRIQSKVEGDWTTPARAVEHIEPGTPADLILICVKNYDTEAALEQIRPVVGPETAVLSLQNGVEAFSQIERIFGAGHAMVGVCYVFASIGSPGVIHHTSGGKIIFGEWNGTETPRAKAILSAFERAGIPAELSKSPPSALWEKYIAICAQAGVTAITRCPSGVIRETPPTWKLYSEIVLEMTRVARAAGIRLEDSVAEKVLANAQNYGANTYSSLYGDLVAGKRLELESLHGYAHRLAEKHGVSAPLIFAIYAALSPHVQGKRQ